MRKGTIMFITGLVMIACSIMLSVWVMSGGITLAVTDGDYEFDINGSNATITGYTGTGTVITIPGSLSDGATNYTVTAIGNNAFYNKHLTQVTFQSPGSVTSIGSKAFYGNDFTTFPLPGSLNDLEQDAFRDCSSLESFNGGGGTYSTSGNCVYKDGGATLYIVPEGIEADNINIPAACTKIASGAFTNVAANWVYIPSTVADIDDGAMDGVSSQIATIYGEAGSEAELYAGEKHITFVAGTGPGPGGYHTVTFDMKGHGTQVAAQNIADGGVATTPTPAPTASNYRFDGWYTDPGCTSAYSFATPVVADITLYAKWTYTGGGGAANYTVRFMANGGTGTMANQQRTVGDGVALTANAFTRSGYTFANWKDENGNIFANQTTQDISTVDGATVILNAQWTQNGAGGTFTITYDMNNGTGTYATQTVNAGSTTVRPRDPVYNGYTFGGWYRDQACTNAFDFSMPINDNYLLYAKWTANGSGGGGGDTSNYTVNFDPNGGSVSVTSKTVTLGSNYGTLPTPTRSGYSFNGWYTSSSGGSQVTSSTTVTNASNHTLYAHWSSNNGEYTVYFDPRGGTVSYDSKKVTYGSSYGTLPTPIRSGYTFSGWYTESSGGTRVRNTTTVDRAENHTLYAHWTDGDDDSNKLTVTFQYNDGRRTVYVTQKISSGGKLSRPADPSPFTVASNGMNFVSGALALHPNVDALTAENTVSDVAAYTAPVMTAATTYYFNGWYKEASCVTLYDFNSPVYSSFSLYAGWTTSGTTTINNGTTVPPGGTAPADGTAGGTSTGSNTGSTGKTHEKDDTPTTGIEDINPRYFLCMAILLTGIATIIYARHQKSKLVFVQRGNRDSGDLD